MDKWVSEYIDYLYDGKHTDAMRFKKENINNKLFRYEKFEECRLETLENSKIYLSNRDNFDDVFDTRGIHYSKGFLKSIYEKYHKPQVSFEQFIHVYENMLNEYFAHCGITCFTVDKDNFPMWWYYADQRKGYCVEYDISSLKLANDSILDSFHPVLYTDKKFKFDKLLETIFDDVLNNSAKVIFHYLLGTIKHKSWSYQKEWRYIVLLEQGRYNFPVKVNAIYLGDKFEESNYNRMKKVAKKLECKLYKMTIPKHTDRKFSFIPVEISY